MKWGVVTKLYLPVVSYVGKYRKKLYCALSLLVHCGIIAGCHKSLMLLTNVLPLFHWILYSIFRVHVVHCLSLHNFMFTQQHPEAMLYTLCSIWHCAVAQTADRDGYCEPSFEPCLDGTPSLSAFGATQRNQNQAHGDTWARFSIWHRWCKKGSDSKTELISHDEEFE